MIDFNTAKELQDLGLSVFPVNISWNIKDKKFDKVPAVPWTKYQSELPSDNELHKWFDTPKYNGIGCATGKVSGIMVVDIDDPNMVGRFPSSVISQTITDGHQQHIFKWTEEIRNTVKINDEALDFRGDGGYIALPPSSCKGKSYKWIEKDFSKIAALPQEFLDLISDAKKEATEPFDHADAFGAKIGTRNDVLKHEIPSLLNKHDVESAWLYTKALNNGFPDPLTEIDLKYKFEKFREFVTKNPLTPSRERTGLNAHNALNAHSEKEKSWPQAPDYKAFRGLAGEIVDTIIPDSEVDPVAILINFLISFGSIIGRRPHYVVGATKHHMNENGIVVGKTAKARKGMAWDYIEVIFREIDPTWKHPSGLSSGEGLIGYVRDPIFKKKTNKVTGEPVETLEDEGVTDKRALVIESEFSRLLKVMDKSGSTLSDILRDAWDGKNLATLKSSVVQATAPHISVLAHITQDELVKRLHESDVYNGFGNRFLMVCVRRTKAIATPRLKEFDLLEMAGKVRAVVEFAREIDEMSMSPDAVKFWTEWYNENFKKEKTGIMGAITDRDEPHILRLACIYALLDKTSLLEVEHIKAAMALWEFCERSIEYIFQYTTGNPLADGILDLLVQAPQTRNQIYNYFSRHKSESEISTALGELESLGKAYFTNESTGGRPIEKWFVSLRAISAESALSSTTKGQTISPAKNNVPVESNQVTPLLSNIDHSISLTQDDDGDSLPPGKDYSIK